MPLYRYTAITRSGNRVSREREATDPDALLAAIAGEVASVESVQLLSVRPGSEILLPSLAENERESLSRGDTLELTRSIADLTYAELPLESGLAALAAECPVYKPRLRRALYGIAQRLSQGESLPDALRSSGASPELQSLIRSGQRAGNTSQVLQEYIDTAQSTAELRYALLIALAYPFLVSLVVTFLVWLCAFWIVPQFAEIFAGFDLNLSMITVALINVCQAIRGYGGWTLLGTFGAVVAIILLLRTLLGRVLFRRVWCRIPLIGTVSRWMGMSRFSRLLGLLLDARVPLPEALALAGPACGDAEIEEDCRKLNARLQTGEPLVLAARGQTRFPASFVRALGWPHGTAGLVEILQSLADMYAGRVRLIVAMLTALLPFLMVVAISITVGFIVLALFMPMIELLNKLS